MNGEYIITTEPARFPPKVSADRPDALLTVNGSSCCVWHTSAPAGENGEKCGCIGHFECEDAGDAQTLIRAAVGELKKHGVKTVLAPMNGNTWKKYRFVTWSDGSAPFYLEPQNPPEYPEWLIKAGFLPARRYSSFGGEISRFTKACDAPPGVSVRHLDPRRFEQEIALIYKLSLECFRQNPFYTAVSYEEFAGLYRPFERSVVPQLVAIAECEGAPAGFFFAFPDPLEPRTVIFKTVGVHPRFQRRGIASAMTCRVMEQAKRLGRTRFVMALLYDGNSSQKLFDGYEKLREYTLYEYRL